MGKGCFKFAFFSAKNRWAGKALPCGGVEMRRKGLTLIELLIVSGPKNNYGCNGPPDGNYSCLTRSLQCL